MKKDSQFSLKLLFRSPIFPVIVISYNKLYTGSNLETLAISLFSASPKIGEDLIKVIDSAGTEFWFQVELGVLSPGFTIKKWTKKSIIELFNNSSNAKDLKISYPIKSLSNKKLSRIVDDICGLIT